MTTAATKILTVGSAAGSIRDLFSKIKAIDAKYGKFDLVLCTGDFFGPLKDAGDETKEEDDISLLLSGSLEAPLECYVMQGDQPLPAKVVEKFAKTGGELCKNVFLMSMFSSFPFFVSIEHVRTGKSGIITTANGLRIACLGGTYDPAIFGSAEAAPGFMSPFFSYHTIDRLLSNTLVKSSNSSQKSYSSLASIQASASSSQLVDILLTNVWPISISNLSSVPLPDPQLRSIGAPPLNEVIRKIKPRYHFAAGPSRFWEREPYAWEDEEGRVSRFVSLGAFGGVPVEGKKQRWFYAFNISPIVAATTPAALHTNLTKNPFLESAPRPFKRPLEDGGSGENFIFGNNVQQPAKRSRTGSISRSHGYSKVNQENLLQGTSAGDANLRRQDPSCFHFINDCPERTKPPDDYICKICNEVGHFVRDCPTRDARGDTGGKKPKPGYVCRACGSEGHYLDDCLVANQRPPQGERRGGKRGPPKEISTDECWFCLSNPNLAKHLIVAIGSECYVTLPKGQIIPTQSAADHVDVPGGGHVLIVPITHYPTYSTIPPDLAPPILDETEKFKAALTAMYAKYGTVPVIFEVGRLSAKGGHAHVQAVPVPVRLKDKIEETFIKEGRPLGIDFEDDADAALASCANGRGSYFKVDLPDGRKMVHLIKDRVPFSIQFGRQALVSLLGTPDRMDWKACMLSEEQDRADAQEFKSAFAPYNPEL
uniref:CCHC-type domain-containing protein n=1 Tax=Psilocybe cubensis TaxID=181762 RepID=A0A8H7Y5J6_PSICU